MDLKELVWSRLPPNTLFPPGTGFDPVFRPLGITVYRTTYGDTPGSSSAGSDRNWQAILGSIQTNADMDQLREIYNAGAAGGKPMNARGELRQCRIFLVADEETLASIAQAQQAGRQHDDEEQ
ncbi:hypothetical protein DL768_009915 [Monosporascus sp. mg162]|nr:hypothetical protein DL768_009915 [Monosporascus sp. mg162]